MTKLVKVLLLLFAIGGLSQNTAQAGASSVESLVSMALTSQSSSSSFQQFQPRFRLAQNSGRRISPSAALRAAKRAAPGSQGLGVRFLPRRQGYLVTLKTRGRIRRVFVNARTGRVGR